ncbi:MAG: hypothetical protein M1834_004749 [Cirrosporium novae-zelandiae]|nr:MAG: hypothetical protein M1834_004749 [Cirrosporium novae-zelandiae]
MNPKLRTNTTPGAEPQNPDTAAALVTSSRLEPIIRENSHTSKDKKKRVSILGRLKPSKKKDVVEFNDDDSELGEKRIEGMNADVFSQPIGFIPQFPSPPKYVKVNSHNKKEKDFNRLFLAQELDGKPNTKTGLPNTSHDGHAGANKIHSKKAHAIWALKFSVDGKYLAAGGQDRFVRVWAVLATSEDRHVHESQEDASDREGERLSAPVFKKAPVREYIAHTASILDLSWSKNNFLLSSSMDKTVRLWHVSRLECLCVFKHSDFVPSVQFHPLDDRFFLAGSLDSKLRFWSIVDKEVSFWTHIPGNMITAVALTPDGKTAIAGTYSGQCIFYETQGLKQQAVLQVRSAYGKNSKGSKITGIEAINFPPDNPNGDIKLLITSNDSRIRMYDFNSRTLDIKFKGHENNCSQIHASFSDDARYVICGSEDRKVYIWPVETKVNQDKDKRSHEMFEAHSDIVTTAVLAPTATKRLLGASGDPIFDLCNPPPVTLVSRSDRSSQASSTPMSEKPINENLAMDNDSDLPSPFPEFKSGEPTKTPAYIARSAHKSGNIVVTADYTGKIKVFRQDCAYAKRRHESWDTHSSFSRKILGRTGSVSTRRSRDSISNKGPERVLSWRNSIHISSPVNSLDGRTSTSHPRYRSVSPSKSMSQLPSRSNSSSLGRSSRVQTFPQSPGLSIGPFSPLSPTLPTRPNRSPRRVNTAINTSLVKPDIRIHDPSPSPPDSTPTGPPPSLPLAAIIPPTVPSTNSPQSPPKSVLTSADPSNPLMLSGDQSNLFWNRAAYANQASALMRTNSSNSLPNNQADGGESPITNLQQEQQVHTLQSRPSIISILSNSTIASDSHNRWLNQRNESYVSRLTSEEEYEDERRWRMERRDSDDRSQGTDIATPLAMTPQGGSIDGDVDPDDQDGERCRRCGSKKFRAQQQGKNWRPSADKRASVAVGGLRLVCAKCGMEVGVREPGMETPGWKGMRSLDGLSGR